MHVICFKPKMQLTLFCCRMLLWAKYPNVNIHAQTVRVCVWCSLSCHSRIKVSLSLDCLFPSAPPSPSYMLFVLIKRKLPASAERDRPTKTFFPSSSCFHSFTLMSLFTCSSVGPLFHRGGDGAVKGCLPSVLECRAEWARLTEWDEKASYSQSAKGENWIIPGWEGTFGNSSSSELWLGEFRIDVLEVLPEVCVHECVHESAFMHLCERGSFHLCASVYTSMCPQSGTQHKAHIVVGVKE